MSVVHARFALIGEEEPGFDSFKQVKYNGKITDKIEIQKWEPVPEKPHCVKEAGKLTLGEVEELLNTKLKELGIAPDDYGFDLTYHLKADQEFPEYHWICCYPVTGSSEGHYMHIDIIDGNGYKHLFTGKTLREGQTGMEYAYEVCKVAALLLGA